MRLTRLYCRGFRGLADTDIELGPGLNILHGANAQGKTSILEAIHYAATTRSHRTNADEELVHYGGEEFHIHLDAESGGNPTRIEAHWWRRAKRFKVNGVPQTRLSDILGRICVVFFAPEDIALVKGAASVRRLFLDMELSQVQPSYLRALQQYRQALRQRNELLRRQCEDADLLGPWEKHLAEYGKILMAERDRYIQELSEIAAAFYGRIVEQEPLELVYNRDVADADSLPEVLRETRKGDLQRRATGRGPHRDDLDIIISGKAARAYGSQGQQKSIALILKLAEVELIRRRTGEFPVLLLDEALAELDAARASRLFAAIPVETQTLITSAQLAQLPVLDRKNVACFHIERGRIEKKPA